LGAALLFPVWFSIVEKVFTVAGARATMVALFGRVAELADAKDLGSFGEILAGSNPVAPTRKIKNQAFFTLVLVC
jgi:hypothetical protein